MYAIEIEETFCAAHALRIPTGTEPLHGHNFQVTVRITCQKLDALQTVMDFHEVEQLLRRILGAWNNQNLNTIEPFRSRVNPSAERVAEQIGVQLQGALGMLAHDPPLASRGVKVAEVRVTEAARCVAIWEAG